ncbi:hypothetical protein [Streptomyces sp. NPDC020377]|uniref:hypothetical protein n=1 Tax=Streptomyces sp. NPDC020377 TaxID=3365070 RepID=UPI003788A82F
MTAPAPRPLADLEQDALVAVEVEFARRASGVKPWTPDEFVDRIEQVHVRYNHRRAWLRMNEQAVS